MVQNLICAVMVDAEQPVGRIELLSTAERTHLLEELNRTGALSFEQVHSRAVRGRGEESAQRNFYY
ncbi:hypothetical protein AAFX91_42180, partial [Bradyrhizobium sp. 31Argb]|uniref:hypothetical protein n=1 Tax=Bradyrhizobium sp. 31Argb TaxID=3141247 RepID=UPI003749B0D6